MTASGKTPDDTSPPTFDASLHQVVDKPWGHFVVLDEGFGYKVKRLEVAPGKRLSYQKHASRSEHWIVVCGVALVTIDGIAKTLHPGDSAFVPVATPHRIQNIGDVPMVFIEVQRGHYLGEDDIVRLQDDFDRT